MVQRHLGLRGGVSSSKLVVAAIRNRLDPDASTRDRRICCRTRQRSSVVEISEPIVSQHHNTGSSTLRQSEPETRSQFGPILARRSRVLDVYGKLRTRLGKVHPPRDSLLSRPSPTASQEGSPLHSREGKERASFIRADFGSHTSCLRAHLQICQEVRRFHGASRRNGSDD